MLFYIDSDLPEWWTNLKGPLSLAAKLMLIKAIIHSQNPNSVFPYPPAINNNIASYMVIVRQDGAVIEGKYTLSGISPAMYTSILCIYYNNNGQEIRRALATGPAGECLVKDDGVSGLTKLEMQVIGNRIAPSNGLIAIDGTYMPTPEGTPNYSTMLGGRNSEICTSIDVKAANMPPTQIEVDASGALLWTILPQKLFPNAIRRLQFVVLNTQSPNIGTISVIEYVQYRNGRLVRKRSLNGLGNMPIRVDRVDDDTDTSVILVSVRPKYPGAMLDPNEMCIIVNYCSSDMDRMNIMPSFTDSQPYLLPTGINNINQPVRKSAILILFIFCITAY